MKRQRFFFIIALSEIIVSCYASASTKPEIPWDSISILDRAANADIVGMGTYVDREGINDLRVNNVVYWLGSTGTNSIILHDDMGEMEGIQPTWTNHPIVFFATTNEWKNLPSNTVLCSDSAWERREKLTVIGPPIPPSLTNRTRFNTSWFPVFSNNTAMIEFASNVVYSMCVSRDLIKYSEALRPALNTDWEDELFVFKRDASTELIELECGESEEFLVHMLNDPLMPRKFRGMALFYLQKRFSWSETNTVPEP